MKNGSKEKIIEAAVELFERYGYEKTTLEDIAGRIGKTKTSVYYYFDGKPAILREVLSREFAAVQSKLIEIWSKSLGKEPFGFGVGDPDLRVKFHIESVPACQ